ncbi:hypothetical protein [Microbacterium halotolerans]|uniref:hypothetical protein n=1 Tax=Microbacterium halotolerans TaxID=246613 RepID=UPI000E6ABAF3|nr:hypothetical protein [Microbacterium halotolerans]
MNVKKAASVSGALSVGVLLLAAAAAGGYAYEHSDSTGRQDEASPVPCNLSLVWDRIDEDFQAVYEDSAMASYSPEYGRIANLSCSDADILEWQAQRQESGLDDEVCRPVMSEDVIVGAVYSIGCAAPVLEVRGEPR